MDKHELTRMIKRKALELGFSKVGVTTAEDFLDYEKELLSRQDYEMWTGTDRSKYPHRAYLRMAAHPQTYYPDGKSIICAVYGFDQYLFPEELTPYVGRAYLSRSYIPQKHSASGLRVAEFNSYIKSLGIDLYEGQYGLPQRMACARAGIITFGKNNFAYTEENKKD